MESFIKTSFTKNNLIKNYFAEVILYGNWLQPIGSIPGNIMQVVVAGIIVVPLAGRLKKRRIYGDGTLVLQIFLNFTFPKKAYGVWSEFHFNCRLFILKKYSFFNISTLSNRAKGSRTIHSPVYFCLSVTSKSTEDC